mgnify:FL=1
MEKIRLETCSNNKKLIEFVTDNYPTCIQNTEQNGEPVKKINFRLLAQMLSDSIIEGDEAYELTWVGKKAAIVEANKTTTKTLRPICTDSVDWDSTANLYLEGDNLEVLKLLQESYLGAIKMIYIDPPYNTGHDFVYPDSFVMNNEDYNEGVGYFDEEGNVNFKRENNISAGKYHSDWCSMIYSRLILARNLLAENGFIAISIGEEELDNLKKICNEVFGEANFRNLVEVRRYDKNLNLQFADQGLSSMNVGLEYILIYSKVSSSKMVAIYRESTDERSIKGYWKGFWNNADRPTMRYNLFGYTPEEGQWKWQESVAREAEENYKVYEKEFADRMTIEEYWKKTGKCKRFLRRNIKGTGKNKGVEHWVAPSEGILRNSNWSDMLVSKPSGVDIPFDSPKNPEVIKSLITLFGVEDGDIVLDFFSGSSSTACAVMELNEEDYKNRKFIMVQVPEICDEKTEAYKAGFTNICEIGKERIRRVAKKIGGNSDKGFRVFRIDDSNMKDIYFTPAETEQTLLSMLESNIKKDRTDLDLLFGCLLEWGLPLSLPYSSEKIDGYTVHNYNAGDLIACFGENVPDSVIKEIAKKQPLRAVFRDSSFAGSPSKINVGEIFKLMAPDTTVKVI